MRLKSLVILVVFCAAFGAAVRAPAQVLECVVASIAADYRQRNDWPMPYVCDDRDAAVEPFDLMVRNGWRAQNMLGDLHFNEKGELNAAGRALIRSVAFDVVPQYRTIFVHRTLKREDQTTRIAAVEKYVAALQPEGGPPPIQETNADLPQYLHGWPTRGSSLTRDLDRITPPGTPYLASPSVGSMGAAGGGSAK